MLTKPFVATYLCAALVAGALSGMGEEAWALGRNPSEEEPASAITDATTAEPGGEGLTQERPEGGGGESAEAAPEVASATGAESATAVRSATPSGPSMTSRVIEAVDRAMAGRVEDATAPEPEKMYKFNFQDEDINKILEWLMQEKNKPVIGKNVQGKFTLRSPKDVTYEEAHRLIEEILNFHGYTIIEDELIIWVVKINEARELLTETIVGMENVPAGFDTHRVLVPLDYADANKVKEKLTPIAPQAEIMVDEHSQSLLIVDTGNNLRRMAGVLEYLDVPSEDADVVREVIPLKFVQAEEAQDQIEDVFRDGSQRTLTHGEKAVPLRVVADENNNLLLVSGMRDDVEAVREFVRKIDFSTETDQRLHMKEMEYAQASQVANTVQQIIRGRKDLPVPPVVVGHDWTNTLIVSGSPEDASWIFAIAQRLDTPKSLDETTEIIPVEHVDVTIMAEYVRGVIEERPQLSHEYVSSWGSRSRSYDTRRSESTIKMIEDVYNNALIVTAPPEQLERVKEVVAQLDLERVEEVEGPRLYELQQADATEVADKVNELFGIMSEGGYRGDFYGGGMYMSGSFGGGRGGRSASPSEQVQAIPLPNINAVAVFANTLKAHENAEQMIRRLDQETPELGSTLVIPLQNANAQEMATLIDELFQQGGESRDLFWFLSGGTEAERLISGLIGKIRISAEPRTNSLIVITSKQNHSAITNLIESLDTATAQVMIEVLLVEVQLDDTYELGIEWGRLDTNGDPGSLTIGSTGRGIAIDRNVDTLDTDGSFSNLLTDSFSDWRWAVLTQTQFDLALHFLDKTGDSQIISRPILMTWDNRGAKFFNGRRVPEVTELRETAGGDLLPQFEYVEIGLILDVTPHINHQNKVDLTINLALDDLTDEQVLGVPIFRGRNVTTNVSIQDGNTVVLAGIIQDTKAEALTKVPVLGDIPILGLPFRNKRDVNTKTELIAFLTPHVVRSATDQENLTELQRQQLRRSYEDKDVEIDETLYDGYRGTRGANEGWRINPERKPNGPYQPGESMPEEGQAPPDVEGREDEELAPEGYEEPVWPLQNEDDQASAREPAEESGYRVYSP